MSTQDTIPEIIYSILLASWRMRRWMPEKVFPLLRDPRSPNDYGAPDGFATLYSFVPYCESATAVIELEAESNRLYIFTSPPKPPSRKCRVGSGERSRLLRCLHSVHTGSGAFASNSARLISGTSSWIFHAETSRSEKSSRPRLSRCPPCSRNRVHPSP